METWFTADLHFGHANIVRYCDRPFASVEAMDAALIANWNERVQPGDTVWVLGDFCFRADADAILARLAGTKHLVRGNHDRRATVAARGWASVQDRAYITVEGRPLVLSHRPLDEWIGKERGVWHLHGHTHGTVRGTGQRCDVGVDAGGRMAPMSLIQVGRRLLMSARAAETRALTEKLSRSLDARLARQIRQSIETAECMSVEEAMRRLSRE